MIKIKKTLATALALCMALAVVPSTASAEAIYSTESGTYKYDAAVAYQYKGGTGTLTSDNYSMCNGVFASEGEVVISGDTATIYLYVANPTPGTWGGLSDGVLNNFVFNYGGVEYPGTTTSIGMAADGSASPTAAVRTFNQDSSFFGITAGDELACDTIEIPNVPVAALQQEYFHLTAFVNLVMKSTQDFFLVLDYDQNGFTAGGSTGGSTGGSSDSSSDGTTITENKEIPLTATVADNTPDYTITIPQSIDLGEIATDADTSFGYAVSLNMGNVESIDISCNADGYLSASNGTGGSNLLAYTNTFASGNHTAGGLKMGTVTVAQANGAAAMAGDYTGTLDFVFVITE